MKCTIPEISWHNREPVLSVHLQPVSESFYRLATGGADCHVLIWQLVINENGGVKIEPLSDLTRHQRAVNAVRWAPGGQYLATADDDANIIIWQLKTDNIPLLDGETNDKETWNVHKVLRGHKEDIYDLCWSPNGLKLLSGSIDNTAILWDLFRGKNEYILTDHKGFVQGVAWDPKGHYVATISTDRLCRIFDSSGKQVKARVQKGFLPVAQDHYLHNKDVKYFHDDTFKSFFRRLDFSPDGSLLAVPSGHLEIEDCKKILNATLVFAVESWAVPVAILPTGKQCSTVTRFCPVLFELHEDGPDPIISLPYRMILAVGTDHDVILYDTQQMTPFAYFKDIHYTRLTDLTWSSDGLLLVASSTDGFCALITFEPDELGIQYVKEESEAEESALNISGCEELDKEDNSDKPKKMNLLEQWTIKTPKKRKDEAVVSSPNAAANSSNTESDYIITIQDSPENNKRKYQNLEKTEIVPKSIKPVLITEDKNTKQVDNSSCEMKKMKPLQVTEDKKTSEEKDRNGTQIKKRITPILVADDKKFTDESVNKVSSAKVSPLLSFLKRAAVKEKSSALKKIKNSSPSASVPPPTIVLDEIEARDAWKCDKEDTQTSKRKTDNHEENTEDFSLHLEDTTSRTITNESQSHNVTEEERRDFKESKSEENHTNNLNEQKNESVTDLNQICESFVLTSEVSNNQRDPEKIVTPNKNCVHNILLENTTDKPTVEQRENSENCVQIQSDINEGVVDKLIETEKNSNNVNMENKPKRRIPLITLSSPKHKKK